MYGMQAISANNGWAISFLGVSIVFTGLVLLSLAISQLYKLLDIWDQRGELLKKLKSPAKTDKEEEPPPILPANVKETAHQIAMVVDFIGQPFALPRLIEMADKVGIRNPHSSVNSLVAAHVIQPDQEGFFTMKKPVL